jgi:hypothetical protein
MSSSEPVSGQQAAERIATRMTAGEAAAELLNHVWFDPGWEHAAAAAVAMHRERDVVLGELIGRVGHGGGSPTIWPGSMAAGNCGGSWHA